MDIDLADTMPNGWKVWLDWQKAVAPDNETEIKALEADGGSWLGYVRVVGRRNGKVNLSDPIACIPPRYVKKVFATARGVLSCSKSESRPDFRLTQPHIRDFS